MRRPEPVQVLQLFPEVRQELLDLLSNLSAEDWERPTACALWSVKDVALHLLGGDIGILSRRRDGFAPGAPPANWAELVALINHLNDLWVKAARRMSPRVLRDLLSFTGPQVEEFFASLDPFSVGFAVDWAGPQPAPVWLDLAREYTERWHHQQQIRDAVGRPGLKRRRFLAPVLDTFVRALPYTFRDVPAADGTALRLSISGESGGDWFLGARGAAMESLSRCRRGRGGHGRPRPGRCLAALHQGPDPQRSSPPRKRQWRCKPHIEVVRDRFRDCLKQPARCLRG